MSYFSIWKLSFWCLSAYGLLHIPIYRSSRWLQCLLWTSHRLVYTVVEWHYCLPWTVEQCQQLAPKVFYIHLGMYTHTYSINDTMQIFYTVFMVYTRPQNWSDGLYQLLAKNITLEVCLPAGIFSFSFSKLHTELHSTMLGSFFDFSHHTNIQSGCSGNANPLQLKTWLELGALQTVHLCLKQEKWPSPSSKDITDITS